MLRLSTCAALLGALAGASPLPAQGPMRPPVGAVGEAPPLARSAEFLLAHTGELKLSDAQVVKLAAIARRAADRRQAMRASADSLWRNMRAQAERDSTGGMQRGGDDQMRARFAQTMQQLRADRRDAIAVLTPDQQATAWELIATRGTMRARMSPGRWQRGRGFGERHRMPDGMRGPERRRGGPPASAPGQQPPSDDSSER